MPFDRLQRAQSHRELERNESCIEITEGDQPFELIQAPNAKRRRAIQQQHAYQKYQETGAATPRLKQIN